jgi:hypothetical protein
MYFCRGGKYAGKQEPHSCMFKREKWLNPAFVRVGFAWKCRKPGFSCGSANMSLLRRHSTSY